MKPILLLFLILTFSTISAKEYRHSLGLKLGMTYSNVTDLIDTKWLPTLNYGLVYKYRFSKYFLFRAEPGLNNKSYRSDFYGVFSSNYQNKYDYYFDLTFHTIELPLLFSFKPIDKKLFLEIMLGINPNYVTKEDIIFYGKQINTVDWGIDKGLLIDVIGGASIGYNLTERINVELILRYGHGLKRLTLMDSNFNGSNSSYQIYFNGFFSLNYKL